MEHPQTTPDDAQKARNLPTVSAILDDGTIVETLYDARARRTAFAVWQDGAWREEPMITTDTGERLVPYSPSNNLLKHRVVLFPSRPEEYGTEADLVAEIRGFLHHYVDLNPVYEQIAAYYVLFAWV